MASGASVDPRVDRYFRALHGPVATIANELRSVVRRTAPRLSEAMKWGNPCYVGREYVCYLAAYQARVNLGFFRGAELAPRPGLLDGTGKGLRHVKVLDAKQAGSAPILGLIREAAALDARDRGKL